MIAKYWYVLGPGRPNYRHPTEESARSEAERLAKLHPRSTFEVLEFVASCKVDGLQWNEAEKIQAAPIAKPASRFRPANSGDIGLEVYASDTIADPQLCNSHPSGFMSGVLREYAEGTEYPYRLLCRRWRYAYVDTLGDDSPF